MSSSAPKQYIYGVSGIRWRQGVQSRVSVQGQLMRGTKFMSQPARHDDLPCCCCMPSFYYFFFLLYLISHFDIYSHNCLIRLSQIEETYSFQGRTSHFSNITFMHSTCQLKHTNAIKFEADRGALPSLNGKRHSYCSYCRRFCNWGIMLVLNAW